MGGRSARVRARCTIASGHQGLLATVLVIAITVTKIRLAGFDVANAGRTDTAGVVGTAAGITRSAMGQTDVGVDAAAAALHRPQGTRINAFANATVIKAEIARAADVATSAVIRRSQIGLAAVVEVAITIGTTSRTRQATNTSLAARSGVVGRAAVDPAAATVLCVGLLVDAFVDRSVAIVVQVIAELSTR